MHSLSPSQDSIDALEPALHAPVLAWTFIEMAAADGRFQAWALPPGSGIAENKPLAPLVLLARSLRPPGVPSWTGCGQERRVRIIHLELNPGDPPCYYLSHPFDGMTPCGARFGSLAEPLLPAASHLQGPYGSSLPGSQVPGSLGFYDAIIADYFWRHERDGLLHLLEGSCPPDDLFHQSPRL